MSVPLLWNIDVHHKNLFLCMEFSRSEPAGSSGDETKSQYLNLGSNVLKWHTH